MRPKRKRERKRWFSHTICDVSFCWVGWFSYLYKVTWFITVRDEIGRNYVSSLQTKEYLPLPSSTTPTEHLSVINHICHTSDGPCVLTHSSPTSPLRLWDVGRGGAAASWGERDKKGINWNVLHAEKRWWEEVEGNSAAENDETKVKAKDN